MHYPSRNLEQYKKLAKDVQHACKSGDPSAIRDWVARWVETLARLQRQAILPKFEDTPGVGAVRLGQFAGTWIAVGPCPAACS